VFIETNQYEDGSQKAHLFVVIFDAINDEDKTILIPFDKIPQTGYYDNTTTVLPEDQEHDFIAVPTYVNYNLGIVRDKRWIDTNGRRRNPSISQDLIQRIQYGIEDSENTPFDVYGEYRNNISS